MISWGFRQPVLYHHIVGSNSKWRCFTNKWVGGSVHLQVPPTLWWWLKSSTTSFSVFLEQWFFWKFSDWLFPRRWTQTEHWPHLWTVVCTHMIRASHSKKFSSLAGPAQSKHKLVIGPSHTFHFSPSSDWLYASAPDFPLVTLFHSHILVNYWDKLSGSS